jgi:hypothetical protein
MRGRIDATPAAVKRWARRFDGREVHVAVEACTGWLFVCDALVAAGAVAHLAEPVETRALRGRKRRAKTDREGALAARTAHRRAAAGGVDPARARAAMALAGADASHAPGGGQMRRVALEVPLRLLAVRRRPEGYDGRAARVQRLEDALDRAALAGGIAPLEEQHHALARLLDPSTGA